MRTGLRLVTLGLLTGCFPEPYPAWVIDHPMPLGIIATVVEPGGYSSELVVPEGHLRAAALPLDTLELQWLAVAPPGTEVPPPIWIVCTDYCANDLIGRGLELDTCATPLPLSRFRPCRLGEGERIRLSLGGTFTADERFHGNVFLAAFSSGDPDLAPETCLQRFSTRPLEGLESCLIQVRTLTLGPPWVLFTGIPAFTQHFILYDDLPDDFADEPPDSHPIVSGIHVTRASSGGVVKLLAQDGDTIHVRAGEKITVSPIYPDDSTQGWYDYQLIDGNRVYIRRDKMGGPFVEEINFRAALTRYVDGYDILSDKEYRQWIAPDDPEPVTLYLYIADNRQGRAHVSLTFITDPSDAATP